MSESKYARRIAWEQWDHRLGREGDREIARQIGCDAAAVRQRRKQLRIPRYEPPAGEDPAWEKDLGRINDYELAERTGVARNKIIARRKQLGIQPAKSRRKARRARPAIWTEQRIAMLGTMTDADLAHHLGLCRSTVERKRLDLGIEPYHVPGTPISDAQIERRIRELQREREPLSLYGSLAAWTMEG